MTFDRNLYSQLNRRFFDMYEFLDEAGAGSKDGQYSPIYRSKLAEGNLRTDYEGSRNVYELFEKSCDAYTSHSLHGKRERYVDGSVGDYVWQSYAEVRGAVQATSKAMRLQGCRPGAKIGIYGPNAPEWTQAMLACFYYSAVCVPMYDTLEGSIIEYIIDHSEIEFVFVSEKNSRKLSEVIQSMGTKASQIREICIWPDVTSPDDAVVKSAIKVFADAGIQVESWAEMLRRGSTSTAASINEPIPPINAETTAVIMYTSGTTGQLLISFPSHYLFQVLQLNKIKQGLESGVHLSWLPLAHAYGLAMELVCIAYGARIGYWQGDVKKLLGDITTLKPTHFLGVPRVWSRIVDGATRKIEERGVMIKTLFDWGFALKKWMMENGYELNFVTSILDTVLFSRISQALGGGVQFVGSGAAPMPRSAEEFLRVTLGVPFMQGPLADLKIRYGLTESCAVTCSCPPDRWDFIATVGVIHACVEIRLQSVPEMGYSVTAATPSGELCLRGPCMFTEYYKNPEEYKKVIDEEGFFHTGDIVELQSTGAIRIIDRMKNIFKLSQGEYVAVEKIENILQQASTVNQIWVYGDSHQRFLVAIIYPNHHSLTHLSSDNASLPALCASEAVKAAVLHELTEVGKSGGLKGFERVHDIALVPEEFTIENGLMTPSSKLKRHELLRRYKTTIDGLYAES